MKVPRAAKRRPAAEGSSPTTYQRPQLHAAGTAVNLLRGCRCGRHTDCDCRKKPTLAGR